MPHFCPTTPPGLLLATDLSARCDRPLERAKQLAAEFNLPLVALTVFDTPATPGDVIQWLDADEGLERQRVLARAEHEREFAGAPYPVTQRLAKGPAAHAIVEVAAGMPGALVIAGASRHDTLGEMILGSTMDKLARELRQPLLVVRQRVRSPYRHLMVAVDFTPASEAALQTATRLFPASQITAFHVQTHVDPEANARADTRFARFFAACALAPEARARVTPVIGQGEPATQLAQYSSTHPVDLAVLGLHDESALQRLLIGSRSEALLQNIQCDTLLIPPGGDT